MLVLRRYPIDAVCTVGILYDGLDMLCFTMELPWLNNQQELSCIPPGAYDVESYSSPLHPDVWQIINVPGRTAILIHPGNTVNDTHGCICVGASVGIVGKQLAVLNSQSTFAMLKQKLPAQFGLTIQ